MIPVPFDVVIAPNPERLEAILRSRLPNKYLSLNTAPGRVTIHSNDLFTPAEFAMVKSIIETESYGLTVVTNKPQITADANDTATILCNSPIIAADASLAYTVTFTGVIDGVSYANGDYASGTVPLESGAVNLTLAVEFVGLYRVELRRTTVGALEFGSVTINAVAGA